MIPSPVKTWYLSSGTGIVLCLLALFLIGNTLYLSSVRDSKAEALEQVSSGLSEYEARLQGQGKGQHPHLKPFLHPVRYGHILRDAFKSARDYDSFLSIREIQLSDVESPTAQPESVHKAPRKKAADKFKVLEITGDIKPAAHLEMPYQKINALMAQIQTDTQCQFSLNKAAAQEANLTDPKPVSGLLAFQLSLNPASQATCLRQYRQPGGAK
jgi:hypothetical protein